MLQPACRAGGQVSLLALLLLALLLQCKAHLTFLSFTHESQNVSLALLHQPRNYTEGAIACAEVPEYEGRGVVAPVALVVEAFALLSIIDTASVQVRAFYMQYNVSHSLACFPLAGVLQFALLVKSVYVHPLFRYCQPLIT